MSNQVFVLLGNTTFVFLDNLSAMIICNFSVSKSYYEPQATNYSKKYSNKEIKGQW